LLSSCLWIVDCGLWTGNLDAKGKSEEEHPRRDGEKCQRGAMDGHDHEASESGEGDEVEESFHLFFLFRVTRRAGRCKQNSPAAGI
jgi:hypothetical protein